MLGRTGHEVLGSARRAVPPLPFGQQQFAFPPAAASSAPGSGRFGTPAQAGGEQLSARRKAAIKKAWKRLDHLGRGSVPLEDALQILSGSTAFGSMAQQEFRTSLERLCFNAPDGRSTLSFAAFSSYYQTQSPGYASDGDFEQFLEAQWGCTDVSDILTALQRQFARVGLMQTFQDQSHGAMLSDVGPEEFKASLRRSGIQVRPDDLHRLFSAFAAPGGGLKLQDFKEQIVAPRPETPTLSRDLALPAVGGGLPPAGGQAATPLGAPPFSTAAVQLPSAGRPGTAPGITPPSKAAALPGLPPHPKPVAAAPGPLAAPPQQQSGPVPTDEDLDEMLKHMESELHHLRKKTDTGGPGPGATLASSPGSAVFKGQAASQVSTNTGAEQSLPEVDGPISDADMDAALSRMEAHIHQIKAHKVQKPAQPAPAPPPVDMPHWEHHKYGHHEIKAPEWKPDSNVTDAFGRQHASSEYNYNNYGAGTHGHHLAHYHLNDYGGLQHHSFQQQDFNRQQYGAQGHHGHWVPHLHGIGTQAHHGEHEYKKDEYQKESYGKEGHHSHWVPHLHGIGDINARPGGAA
uniref:EF-hand domain-containing protein n=1 Tax=Alexandrium monilatum TaxID=311494 RepID=A0A7S4Q9Y0_9DINO|mmetsp:Transcript_72342/g.215897  ORF Transcript_72342/g.215897 Transcript_72342/m.215897 type:complete len:574 (-) Transcript_72342:25-1746(-)